MNNVFDMCEYLSTKTEQELNEIILKQRKLWATRTLKHFDSKSNQERYRKGSNDRTRRNYNL